MTVQNFSRALQLERFIDQKIVIVGDYEIGKYEIIKVLSFVGDARVQSLFEQFYCGKCKYIGS